MCGIFFYRSSAPLTGRKARKLKVLADNIRHRGPDATRVVTYARAMAVFHRLQIVDPHPEGMQPFEGVTSAISLQDVGFIRSTQWMCMINGEIYNYRNLYEKIHSDYTPKSHSDCEVVFSLFLTYVNKFATPYDALCQVLQEIDGEYAIVIYNATDDYVIAVTDELRMRPLFISTCDGKTDIYITSEQKAAKGVSKPIMPGLIYVIGKGNFAGVSMQGASIQGASIQGIDARSVNTHNIRTVTLPAALALPRDEITVYASPIEWSNVPKIAISLEDAAARLYELLTANVHAKMHSDRNYGFLLSGGIDSSLICGIAANYCRQQGLPRIRTFTVGFSQSAPDIIAAWKVATHIDSIHEEIIVPYRAGIDIIDDVIKSGESWDQTTVRASIPMAIAVRWIKKRHPDIAVVYSGEVADELLRGYLYNKKSVSEDEARADMAQRLIDISMFDGLRADRMIASQGMEGRFPFFSRALLQFVFSLPWEYLDPTHNNGVEKYLLRKAFDGLDVLPQCIIWRTKNAFSDATSVMIGTSAKTAGDTDAKVTVGSEWKEMLKAHAEKYVTKQRFEHRNEIYPGANIQTREDMYYMDIFDSYGYNRAAIPYKWLPSWVDGATDSSATMLSVFSAN